MNKARVRHQSLQFAVSILASVALTVGMQIVVSAGGQAIPIANVFGGAIDIAGAFGSALRNVIANTIGNFAAALFGIVGLLIVLAIDFGLWFPSDTSSKEVGSFEGFPEGDAVWGATYNFAAELSTNLVFITIAMAIITLGFYGTGIISRTTWKNFLKRALPALLLLLLPQLWAELLFMITEFVRAIVTIIFNSAGNVLGEDVGIGNISLAIYETLTADQAELFNPIRDSSLSGAFVSLIFAVIGFVLAFLFMFLGFLRMVTMVLAFGLFPLYLLGQAVGVGPLRPIKSVTDRIHGYFWAAALFPLTFGAGIALGYVLLSSGLGESVISGGVNTASGASGATGAEAGTVSKSASGVEYLFGITIIFFSFVIGLTSTKFGGMAATAVATVGSVAAIVGAGAVAGAAGANGIRAGMAGAVKGAGKGFKDAAPQLENAATPGGSSPMRAADQEARKRGEDGETVSNTETADELQDEEEITPEDTDVDDDEREEEDVDPDAELDENPDERVEEQLQTVGGTESDEFEQEVEEEIDEETISQEENNDISADEVQEENSVSKTIAERNIEGGADDAEIGMDTITENSPSQALKELASIDAIDESSPLLDEDGELVENIDELDEEFDTFSDFISDERGDRDQVLSKIDEIPDSEIDDVGDLGLSDNALYSSLKDESPERAIKALDDAGVIGSTRFIDDNVEIKREIDALNSEYDTFGEVVENIDSLNVSDDAEEALRQVDEDELNGKIDADDVVELMDENAARADILARPGEDSETVTIGGREYSAEALKDDDALSIPEDVDDVGDYIDKVGEDDEGREETLDRWLENNDSAESNRFEDLVSSRQEEAMQRAESESIEQMSQKNVVSQATGESEVAARTDEINSVISDVGRDIYEEDSDADTFTGAVLKSAEDDEEPAIAALGETAGFATWKSNLSEPQKRGKSEEDLIREYAKTEVAPDADDPFEEALRKKVSAEDIDNKEYIDTAFDDEFAETTAEEAVDEAGLAGEAGDALKSVVEQRVDNQGVDAKDVANNDLRSGINKKLDDETELDEIVDNANQRLTDARLAIKDQVTEQTAIAARADAYEEDYVANKLEHHEEALDDALPNSVDTDGAIETLTSEIRDRGSDQSRIEEMVEQEAQLAQETSQKRDEVIDRVDQFGQEIGAGNTQQQAFDAIQEGDVRSVIADTAGIEPDDVSDSLVESGLTKARREAVKTAKQTQQPARENVEEFIEQTGIDGDQLKRRASSVRSKIIEQGAKAADEQVWEQAITSDEDVADSVTDRVDSDETPYDTIEDFVNRDPQDVYDEVKDLDAKDKAIDRVVKKAGIASLPGVDKDPSDIDRTETAVREQIDSSIDAVSQATIESGEPSRVSFTASQQSKADGKLETGELTAALERDTQAGPETSRRIKTQGNNSDVTVSASTIYDTETFDTLTEEERDRLADQGIVATADLAGTSATITDADELVETTRLGEETAERVAETMEQLALDPGETIADGIEELEADEETKQTVRQAFDSYYQGESLDELSIADELADETKGSPTVDTEQVKEKTGLTHTRAEAVMETAAQTEENAIEQIPTIDSTDGGRAIKAGNAKRIETGSGERYVVTQEADVEQNETETLRDGTQISGRVELAEQQEAMTRSTPIEEVLTDQTADVVSDMMGVDTVGEMWEIEDEYQTIASAESEYTDWADAYVGENASRVSERLDQISDYGGDRLKKGLQAVSQSETETIRQASTEVAPQPQTQVNGYTVRDTTTGKRFTTENGAISKQKAVEQVQHLADSQQVEKWENTEETAALANEDEVSQVNYDDVFDTVARKAPADADPIQWINDTSDKQIGKTIKKENPDVDGVEDLSEKQLGQKVKEDVKQFTEFTREKRRQNTIDKADAVTLTNTTTKQKGSQTVAELTSDSGVVVRNSGIESQRRERARNKQARTDQEEILTKSVTDFDSKGVAKARKARAARTLSRTGDTPRADEIDAKSVVLQEDDREALEALNSETDHEVESVQDILKVPEEIVSNYDGNKKRIRHNIETQVPAPAYGSNNPTVGKTVSVEETDQLEQRVTGEQTGDLARSAEDGKKVGYVTRNADATVSGFDISERIARNGYTTVGEVVLEDTQELAERIGVTREQAEKVQETLQSGEYDISGISFESVAVDETGAQTGDLDRSADGGRKVGYVTQNADATDTQERAERSGAVSSELNRHPDAGTRSERGPETATGGGSTPNEPVDTTKNLRRSDMNDSVDDDEFDISSVNNFDMTDDKNSHLLSDNVDYDDSDSWVRPPVSRNSTVQSPGELPHQGVKMHVSAPEGKEKQATAAISDALDGYYEENGAIPRHKFANPKENPKENYEPSSHYGRLGEGTERQEGKFFTVYPTMKSELRDNLDEAYTDDQIGKQDWFQDSRVTLMNKHQQALRDLGNDDLPSELEPDNVKNPVDKELANDLAERIHTAYEEHPQLSHQNAPTIGKEDNSNGEVRLGSSAVHARYARNTGNPISPETGVEDDKYRQISELAFDPEFVDKPY